MTCRTRSRSFWTRPVPRPGKYHDLPFGFPVAVKPANSVEYLHVDFPGRKKAFILHTPEELAHVVSAIYGAGYGSELIIQDFIPGSDANMRVLNAYVDHDHHVRMMVLGHVRSPTDAGGHRQLRGDHPRLQRGILSEDQELPGKHRI